MQNISKAAVPTRKSTSDTIPASPMTAAEYQRSKALRDKSWFKEKYLNSLRTVTRTRMEKLLREQAGYAFKDLLSDLLGEMPPEAPPQLLLIMTRFIIEEWEKTEVFAV